MYKVRILGPNGVVMATFELGEDDGCTIEVDRREYVGVRMPTGDSPPGVPTDGLD